MEIINLGEGDGLPPVDWAAVTETLDAGSAPAPDAHNARTTWLATLNEDGSPHVTAVGAPGSMGRSGSKRVRAPGRAATWGAIPVARLPCRSATRTSSSRVTPPG
jgi:hypothetical protein